MQKMLEDRGRTGAEPAWSHDVGPRNAALSGAPSNAALSGAPSNAALATAPIGVQAGDASSRAILTAAGHDNTIRWRAGERLQDLFEQAVRAQPDGVALDVNGVTVTFAALELRANQMARYLAAQGIAAGDRVGLIVDRSIEAYVALLAVVKCDAAYVPLDIKFPAERIAFIAEDAGIKAMIVTGAGLALVEGLGDEPDNELALRVIDLGAAAAAADAFAGDALGRNQRSAAPDPLSYIIYTSGSTGRPKGVAVNHSSICNFVRVAAAVYGYVASDRVYQGMTLAFDFSVEELWVPLISGATLVPSPADRQMVGEELGRFLAGQRISAMCCVPTLLATLDDALPELRLLLVSGEACPQDIVTRWQRPGRRMLNAYGPTEAPVTATWTEVRPDKAVTIGVPLPTYTIAILETARDALVADGAAGEIAIAGIGLAEGYVNRADLTAKAFVPDFLQLANNPSRRLYRTGDLGRINDEGEIVYLGRIDAQVKIRGYRIELAEIENVLLEIDGIAQAVVTTHEAEPGLIELAAYVTCFEDGAKPRREAMLKVLRSRLPGYMVPAYVEELDVIPLLASHKADRKALPPPSGLRLVSGSGDFVQPRTEMERLAAECLAEVMKLEAVSVDDHFFDDLGAHSLLMGQFVAKLNARIDGLKAAISDVYLAPTIALIATELDDRLARDGDRAEETAEALHIARDFDYWRCGALQALLYAVEYAFYLGIAAGGTIWVAAATDGAMLAERALTWSAGALGVTLALPVAAKWLIIGRWRAGRIPIWSMDYFRFWMVLHLTAFSPWLAFRGTALFNVYLRLLGARIGDSALILTERVPVGTDLIGIGDRSVLRKAIYMPGYRAENGYIHLGPIEIGADVTVGERALVDIDTAIGDGGQLGHASALLSRQRIEPGRRYHGSPAVATEGEFRHLPTRATSWLRRSGYAAMRLVSMVVTGAVMLAVLATAAHLIGASGGSTPGDVVEGLAGVLSATGFLVVLLTSVVLFSAGLAVSGIVHLTVPRMLRSLLVAGKVYPLYGPRYYIAEMLSLFGLMASFQKLFGDSSAIVHYFRWLGVRQPNLKQTGSNFGISFKYESAADIEIGSGSMISDGLSVVNYEIGSGSFRVVPATVGETCFVGNSIVYPSGARIGDNCLLGTKVMIPLDGKLRENVGLLGSPAFEIPREVVNGRRFNPVPSTAEEHARLAAKNRFNLRTGLLYLMSQWLLLAGLLVIGHIAAQMYAVAGYWAIAGGAVAAPVLIIVHGVLADRLSLAGVRMEPRNCTIHEVYFWWIERHWKLGETWLKYAFAGTPFRPLMMRLMGLKVGRKVFDGGAMISEKRLTEIGDYCCLNVDSSIQGHSLEDGLFKSDRIVIGAGCTIGPAAFVHYGVRMEARTVLAPDAFLMKGARTEGGSRWQGNPARVS